MTTSAAQTLKLEYVKTIGIVNNAPVGRGFANPVDLAVRADGRIFVLNRGAPVFTRIGVITGMRTICTSSLHTATQRGSCDLRQDLR